MGARRPGYVEKHCVLDLTSRQAAAAKPCQAQPLLLAWPTSRLSTQWVPVHSAWFNPKLVVYSGFEPLVATDVGFRSLHRNMTEKELDLFKFSTGGVAKPRTGSAEVVL
jgi:hypothetical protein